MMIRNIWVRAIWYSMALLMVVEATNSGSTDGCVMRGQCGSHGAPCVDPGSPELPDDETFREKMKSICGAHWIDRPEEQLDTLKEQASRAYQLIGSCGACWKNFREFWCSFTCAPNQADFVSILNYSVPTIQEEFNKKDNKVQREKPIVSRVEFRIAPKFGITFFDSCKDVKFGSDNNFAMALIGGGATDYIEMMRFMGQARLGGSPFQIDFPDLRHVTSTQKQQLENSKMLDIEAIPCHSTDTTLRCSCVDCESTCPVLAPIENQKGCFIASGWSCWYTTVLAIYLAFSLVGLGLIIRWCTRRGPLSVILQDESERPLNIMHCEAPIRDRSNSEESTTDSLQSLLSPNIFFAQRGSIQHYPLNQWLQIRFYRLGYICASQPFKTLTVGLVLVMVASMGMWRFAVETDPLRLWVSSTSEAAQEKTYFDEHFGPFYRTEQIIFHLRDNATAKTILAPEYVRQLFLIQKDIQALGVRDHHAWPKEPTKNRTLLDFCLQPLKDGNCAIESITGYWQDDLEMFDQDVASGRYFESLEQCIAKPVDCLPAFLQPIKPDLILGGKMSNDPMAYKALVVTFVVENSMNSEYVDTVKEWEQEMVKYLKSIRSYSHLSLDSLEVSFSTESSIEREINRETASDVPTILISYLVMFLYATLSLGNFSSVKRFFIDAKISVGFSGIIIVIASCTSAIGLVSYFGMRITMIIAEVIPFLVLAIGVDNLFLLVHTFERVTAEQSTEGHCDTVERRIAMTLSRTGPSVLLSALSETLAFGLGSVVSMPAVRSFAIVAALAVWIDFCLQITCFAAVLALDAKRAEAGRVDCIPCIRMEDQENVKTFRESWLQYLFRKFYAPLLLNRYFKVLVVMIFSSGFLFSLYHVDKVPMGLDQRIALPRDSYLVNYFDGLENYLSVGPPVYFVAKDINVTTLEGQAKLCGRYGGCNERSLAVLLEQERKRPDVSFIAQPTANWLDDYFAWLSPSADLCCRLRIDQRRHRRVNKRSSSGKQASLQQRHTSPTQRRFNASPNNQKQHRFNTLPSRRQKPNDPNVLIQKRFKGKDELCSPDDWEEDCEQCFPGDNLLAYNQTLRGLPKSHQFLRFLDLFLTAMPSEDCALGGAAAYTNAVIVDHERQTVKASHFRTYHTVLKTQKDFIDAYASAKRIARQMSEEHGMQVYPYSIFYVFFEQYTYLFTVGAWMMGGAMVAVFLLCWLFMGNIQAAIIVTLMVVMTVVDLVGGVMMFWGIELNAVTLVNIVICVGISVEFCTHITRAFSITPPSKELTSLVRVGPMSEVNVVMDEKSLAGMGSKNRRVFVSLVEVGSSVFSGITLTKFCGIMVLYFAQSKLFEIYYFRMYLGIVVLGAAHGLILLPILLSWFGSRNILSPIIRIVEHE